LLTDHVQRVPHDGENLPLLFFFCGAEMPKRARKSIAASRKGGFQNSVCVSGLGFACLQQERGSFVLSLVRSPVLVLCPVYSPTQLHAKVTQSFVGKPLLPSVSIDCPSRTEAGTGQRILSEFSSWKLFLFLALWAQQPMKADL
jgi:hypothetical protein